MAHDSREVYTIPDFSYLNHVDVYVRKRIPGAAAARGAPRHACHNDADPSVIDR